MTNKQIIDGVDVSGCVHFIQEEKDCCDLGGSCKGWTTCYYKSWKRKEQENKDLREDIKDIANLLDLDTGEEYNFGNIELEIKQLKAKKQEYERLKLDLIEANCLNNLALSVQLEQLKKTLQEIKEIAEGRTNYPCSWCINKEILQKISEVKDE